MASPRERGPGRRLALIVAVLGVLIGGGVLAVLHLRGGGSAAADSTPAVVARVGTQSIGREVFEARVNRTVTVAEQGGAPQAGTPQYPKFLTAVRTRVLQSLIVDGVIAEEAQARGLATGDAAVETELQAEAGDAGGLDKLVSQLGDVAGTTDRERILASERDAIRARLNEQALEDFFARARAADVEQQLAGGAAFEVLARSLSDDQTSRARGGDLGAVSLDQLHQDDPGFLAAVEALTPGRTSAVAARDNAGYEVLRLDARAPTSRSLHRILVAAPRPYTVQERPVWFSQAIFQAIAEDCARGRISSPLPEGAGLCSPQATPPAAASGTPSTPTPTPAPTPAAASPGFTPRP